MPKIIGEVYEKIMKCTKRIMFEEGYQKISLRSIAKECGIAVGTIYNYFESKEMLIATILLEDWKKALERMDNSCEQASNIQEGLLYIYDSIEEFCKKYEDIWNQSHDASTSIKSRHYLLQNQIVNRINDLLDRFSYSEDKDMSVIVAECVLTCATRKEISVEQYQKMIKRLFCK